MLDQKYIQRLQKIIRKYFSKETNPVFIFGSSVEKEHFRDIDVAILGKVDEKKFFGVECELEESTFPYLVDLVIFDSANKEFQDCVLHNPSIKWI